MSSLDRCECSREGIAILLGCISGGAGGLAGALTGAAIGSKDKFIMPNAESMDKHGWKD